MKIDTPYKRKLFFHLMAGKMLSGSTESGIAAGVEAIKGLADRGKTRDNVEETERELQGYIDSVRSARGGEDLSDEEICKRIMDGIETKRKE